MKNASFNDEDVETLVNLGLRANQAKIYFTLLSLGCSNAKRIAQTMQMDTGDVYRRLEILNEKGLIEKILHNPMEYKSVPLKDAIKVLFEPKNEEYAELQKRIKLMLKKEVKPVTTSAKEEYSFLIIPQNEARKQYIFRATERVEKEWVTYSQIERWPIAITGYYETNEKALDRGISFRVILELNKPTDEILNFIKKYQDQHPNYEVRYTDSRLLVSFAIYDKKEMNFSTEELKGLANSQVLVTDNPQLVKVVHDYFELRWKTAMKEYPKKEEK